MKQITLTILLFLSAILLAVVGGAFMGIITAFVASFFYIILFFPLGMGVVSGNVVRAAVELGRVNKMMNMLVLAVLTTFSLYSMYHYGHYVALQFQTSLEMFGSLTPATNEDNFRSAKTIVDGLLENETGKSGFAGYLIYRAEEGITIARIARSSQLHLGSSLTWLFWLIEFVIILGVAVLVSKKDTLVPICSNCGSRYGRERHLGGTSEMKEELIMNLLQRRSFVELGKLLVVNAAVPSIEFYAQSCERCGKGDTQLLLRRVFTGNNGRLRHQDIQKMTLPRADYALLSKQRPTN